MNGQPTYRPGELIPGTIYRTVTLLGSGGMGTVYEVEDTSVGKHYVLKTLHAGLADRADLHARIEKEARTLARLSHPNIVEVVTAGATDDAIALPYLVMEKLNGFSLRTLLDREKKIPLERALSIALELLDALDFAHEHGVVHRDVKPDNIFLHRRPHGETVTKLLDFGILMLTGESTSGERRRFVGTTRYASPEQLRGDLLTGSSDLYAIGLILYESLSGHGPFDGAHGHAELADAHIHREPPSLRARVELPDALDRLISMSLSKSPVERPASAKDFAQAIRQIQSSLPRKETSRPAAPRPATTATTVRVTSAPREHLTTSAARPQRATAITIACAICAVAIALAISLSIRAGRKPFESSRIRISPTPKAVAPRATDAVSKPHALSKPSPQKPITDAPPQPVLPDPAPTAGRAPHARKSDMLEDALNGDGREAVRPGAGL